jgi:hypothetical protein
MGVAVTVDSAPPATSRRSDQVAFFPKKGFRVSRAVEVCVEEFRRRKAHIKCIKEYEVY